MPLINLTRVMLQHDDAGNPLDDKLKPMFINTDHIATIMDAAQGCSIGLRGFKSNLIFTQTKMEVQDAIAMAIEDDIALRTEVQLPIIIDAILTALESGRARHTLRDILCDWDDEADAAGDGSGTVPSTIGL